MTDPDPNVSAVFQQFAEQVADEFPVLREILDQAKAGDITEEDALRALSEVILSDPALGGQFQQVAMQAMAPLRPEDAAKPLDHGGLVQHGKRGLPRLNPLVEAALAERVQFDGDIPELRTGALPPGQKPAVPVDTDARNPVALGQMLGQASDEVLVRIEAAEPARKQLVGDEALLDLVEQGGTAVAVRRDRDLIFDGKSAALDVPEYRRGQLPAPRRVTQPSGSALLALTPEERKQSAWAFLSTTQGRRSAVRGLTDLIDVKLQGEGFEVTVRPFDPRALGAPLAYHEWSVTIDGPGATQAAFSLIDTAAAAIAKGLTRKMDDRRGKVTLEVTAVNTVDIRLVGWAGRLLAGDAALPATG